MNVKFITQKGYGVTMPLGWIDFSKTERNKVMSVLDLLSEPGTLDELGIAPVRDGFADLFFPGTSTIQRKAKYFLIIPYAFKDLEYSKETNPNRIWPLLDEIEKDCCHRLMDVEKKDTEGIIGSRAMAQKRWLKRKPSSIYWAGLKQYGIFSNSQLSMAEYIRASCEQKIQKSILKKTGNRNDQAEEHESDDLNAGGLAYKSFWTVPTYNKDWKEKLVLKLTKEEGEYLRHRIIESCPDSLMAYILKTHATKILHCKKFRDLGSMIADFPEGIKADYALAVDFAEFLYVLRILYNLILSNSKNMEAINAWENVSPKLSDIARVDLDNIIKTSSDTDPFAVS